MGGMSEKLHFCFDDETGNMRADVSRAIWSDMLTRHVALARNVDDLVGRQDSPGALLVDRGDSTVRAQFDFAGLSRALGPERRQALMRGLLLFINGIQYVAGPELLDPYFMVEGSIIRPILIPFHMASGSSKRGNFDCW